MEVKKAPVADLEGKKTTWLLVGYIFILALIFVAFEWTKRDKVETGEIIAEGVASSALVGAAFETLFGKIGSMFIALAILLFAYSTILGWSVYGTKAWEYLFGTKSTIIYKVIFVAIVFVGPMLHSSLAWDISDTFNGLMMIPNLIGVVVLCPVVYKITRNYIDRHIKGKDVEPMVSVFKDINDEYTKEVMQ